MQTDHFRVELIQEVMTPAHMTLTPAWGRKK